MSSIGDYVDAALIRGIDEGIGAPGVVQSFHATPADGSLELPTGDPGPAGPAGPAAAAFRWEGDIADRAALNALAPRLRLAHAGKAWRVKSDNSLVYWDGTGFENFVDAFGGAGPDGETHTLTIGTVTTGPVGSLLEVTLSGTPPNLVLDLTIPRGVAGRKGDPGPPGPIRSAPDYLDGTHTQDMVPLWDTAAGKWVPRPLPAWRGPWALEEHQAWDGGAGFAASQSNISATTLPIATLNVPAQDVDWRPFVTGGVMVRTVAETAANRVDAEVRLGSTSGQYVGYGTGLPWGVDFLNHIVPFYATASMTPASSVGVVAAGAAATLHVVLSRTVGSGNYTYSQARSHLVCWAVPVSAP
ncbi:MULTISPECIES: hypothetical protein [unclassified Nocardia]|uniref:hypothetical protein n=1 Tax=unclassified Nocardia TaxID=2637762 RepID=UPI00278C1648|nr:MULTISPECIES: hypothetical protein [unclassified Nocardia]